MTTDPRERRIADARQRPGRRLLSAIIVVMNAVEGGVPASSWIDSVAKRVARLLPDFPFA